MTARANPEHRLQRAVAEFLTLTLPHNVEWTASLSGAYLSPMQRAKAKATGLRRGFPDLQFILPDRTVRFIEIKAERGVLSADQKRIRDALHADHWAEARSIEDVVATLTAWGVQLRPMTVGSARNSLLNDMVSA